MIINKIKNNNIKLNNIPYSFTNILNYSNKYCNNRYFSKKSRNLFDDDDGEEEEIEIDHVKRDQEFREMRNRPYKGTYHRTIIENLKKGPITPGKKYKIDPVEFTDEEIFQVIKHEMKSENEKNQRNFFKEEINENEQSSIKPIEFISNKDVIEDDRFSYKDLNDEGFELLLKEIFKNKRTGQCDLDDDDLKEIKKMLMVSDNFQLNILDSNTLTKDNKDN